jgi:ASC-1-like (ASCH) protein
MHLSEPWFTLISLGLKKVEGRLNKGKFKEELQNCLPGISNMDTGLSVYYKYYTKEDEKKFGIVAIQLATMHT